MLMIDTADIDIEIVLLPKLDIFNYSLLLDRKRPDEKLSCVWRRMECQKKKC